MGDIPEMTVSNTVCEVCSKACEEAKAKVASLEKKNFRLAMALTSALTLLGEQGARAVIAAVESMRSVSEPASVSGGASATGSGGDGYTFGGGEEEQPVFARWAPSWTGGSGSVLENDPMLPPDGWSPATGTEILGNEPDIVALASGEPKFHLDITSLATPRELVIAAPQVLSEYMPTHELDFRTPSPFGGYTAHLETEPAHVLTVPSAGATSLLLLAGLEARPRRSR